MLGHLAVVVRLGSLLGAGSAHVGVGPVEVVMLGQRVAFGAEVLDDSCDLFNNLNRGIIR